MANEPRLADHARTTQRVPYCPSEDDMRAAAAVELTAALYLLRPPPPAPEGHIVYFVGGETGPVKIGFTQQPIKERLKCIQNGSPVKLHVLALRKDGRAREAVYHRQFAAHRLHGEWFERCPEIEEEIRRLGRETTRLSASPS